MDNMDNRQNPATVPGAETVRVDVVERQYRPRTPQHAKAEKPGNIWITVLKIFAWCMFVGIIVMGIFSGVQYANTTAGLTDLGRVLSIVISAVISLIIAFLTISGLMVFLDLARDISDIRIQMDEADIHIVE